MLLDLLKCREKVVKTSVMKTKNRRIIVPSKYFACGSKKSKVFKEPEASGVLSSLKIKTPLSKISLVGPFLF